MVSPIKETHMSTKPNPCPETTYKGKPLDPVELAHNFGRRAVISVTLEIDMDALPGMFHQVDDWECVVRESLLRQSQYNPEVTFDKVQVKKGDTVLVESTPSVGQTYTP